MKKSAISALKYFLHMFEGTDGRLSIKRVLATIAIISGIKMAWYGIKYRIEHLDSITGIVMAIMGVGATLLGITTLATYKRDQLNTTTDTTKIIDTPPADATIIKETTQTSTSDQQSP